MTDIKNDDFQYEGAHEANRDLGGSSEGKKLLSSKIGETVLNKYEESVRLKNENIRDPLTGLYNRRFLETYIKDIKPDEPITFFMIDVDNFKNINDKWGHPTGDKTLKSLARLLQDKVQIIGNGQTDVVVRWGGEEFVVLFRNFTDRKITQERAEQIRKAFADSFIVEGGEKIKTTLSVGIAYRKPQETSDNLLKRADAALYEAKRTGRNRIVISDEND